MNIFYCKIKDLTLKPDNNRAWLDYLEINDGKKVVVEITEDKPKRSLDQNALYWLYLNVIAKETGNLEDDLHQLFKRKFLPPVPKKILNVEFKLPASTTNLTKVEFGEYLHKISAFTEIPIPETIKKEFNIESVYPINNLEVKF